MSEKQNGLILYVIIGLLVGGIAGYSIGQSNQRWSNAYMQGTANMMNNNANSMMQMGRMMMGAGQMMQQKGISYNDTEMMSWGKDFEINGTMMQNNGNEMMGRSNGMMGMMR